MSASVDSDTALVQRSLAGETGAFAQLVEKHQRLVYGVALSSARDEAIAEDAAQEAFVEAWRELRRLRDPGRVGSWIAGIARNLARGRSRTAARRRKHAQTLATAAEATPPSTPLDAALRRESSALLGEALEQIPAAYREVLVLFYAHGQSTSDVAAGLGVSEDLVKQRLSRGRRALRDRLERELDEALGHAGPSKTFTTTVMVAVAAAIPTQASAAVAATSAGKLIPMMTMNKVMLGVAAVAVGAGVTWYGLSRDTDAPGARTPDARVSGASSLVHPAGSAASASPRGRTGARRFTSSEERHRLLETIRRERSRNARGPAPSGGAGPSPDLDAGRPIDQEYIRSSVRELIPFLGECYEQLTERSPADGAVIVNFTIEGDPTTGGLIGDVEIDPASDLKDPEFQECFRQTMLALEIDPPEDGGVVNVRYPFTFRRVFPE